MTAEELGARLVELLGVGTASVSAGGEYRRACVDVPPESWTAAAAAARDALDLTFFDWLTGVDAGQGGFDVVVHLWSPAGRYGALLRTAVPRAQPRLPSLVPLFPGAAWHERETHEMFGVAFDGHPDLRKLLLPDEFDGHPLRKDFVLAARVAKAWPGAKEPGESDSGAPARRRMRPPGVPDPADWGPDAAPADPPADGSGGARTAADTASADTAPADTAPADTASADPRTAGGATAGAPADGGVG